MDSTLRSGSQFSVTAFEQNDSSSSPQIDKADTDLSFYSTRNEGEIGEITTFIPALAPSPPFPSTLFSEVLSEQTYGTQVSVDERDENKVQLAYPPSDGTDVSQLPPLVPVRRHSQSQLNGRTQSTTTSSPVAQNTSIKVSYVPQTQTPRTSGNIPALSPRTSGESWNSERSSSLTPQQYTIPLQQSAPATPSTYSEIPSQPYRRSQSVETPQPHTSESTQPSIPPSDLLQSYIIPNVPTTQANRSGGTQSAPTQSYRLPGAPTPQANRSEGTKSVPIQSYPLPGAPTPQAQSMYAGVSQPFISQTSGSPFGHVPSRTPRAIPYSHPIAYNSIGQTTTPQTFRKANVYVASDPFRVTHRNEKVDAPSDGLTFDDIPTAGRPPGPVRTRPSRSYSLPGMPTQSRYPGTASQSYSLPIRPIPQGQSVLEGTSEQFIRQPASSQYYSTSDVPKPQTSQPIYAETPQQFIPQSSSSRFYNNPNVPTPQAQSIHTGTPPQSYSLPNRPTPQAHSVHSGTPPQSYSLPNSLPNRPQASQPIYTGTPEQFIPQPTSTQFYNIPNAPAPQAQPIHTGISQPSQMPGSYPGASYILPTPSYYTGYNPTSQVIKPHSYVANDPFQVSYGGAVVDAPSNFDDISTARSSPVPGMGSSYGALPRQPTYGGYYYPGTTTAPPVGAYGQSHISTHPGAYSTFNDERPWYQPEIHHSRINPGHAYNSAPLPDAPPIIIMDNNDTGRRPNHKHHAHYRQQTPPTPQDDDSKPEDTGLAQPHLPSTPYAVSVPVQSEELAQERRRVEEEEDVPSTLQSIHNSPIIAPNADDTVTPPAVPANRPSSPSRSQDHIPITQHEPHKDASRSSFGSYIFDPSGAYLRYPPIPYLQQSQYTNPPKKSRFSRFFGSSRDTYPPANPQPFTAIYPQPFTEPYTVIYPSMDPEIDWHESVVDFFLVAFPKQMYLLLLLRLPSLYFARVARIFEEADLSLPEIKKMALETASQGLTHEYEIEMAFESPSVSPAYKRLTTTWESFIDSVMREWKTFNIISVLLLTAILTILQINSAADDPVTRYTALFSLMCALISLLFGCMYIIRFGTMRKTYKAAEWALEAKRSKTLIWWNVWILLAMPVIWLTWSIILYIACIMSFIWRTGVATTTNPPGLSDTGLLVIRIVMSVVLGIGVLYGFLIMTTFQRYGLVMDKAWKQRIDEWIAEKAAGNIDPYTLDDRPYPPPHWYPDQYQRPTPSRYYQPSYGGRYPRNTPFIPGRRMSDIGSVFIPPDLSPASTGSPKPTHTPIDPYTLDDGPYPPPHWYSDQYQRPTPSRYYQPSYGGRYPRNTVHIPPSPSSSNTGSPIRHVYPVTHVTPPTIVHLPPGSPHSTRSSSSINRPGPNQPAPQSDTQVPAANSGATPPIPNSKGPVATPEESPPRIIPERTLYPILESSIPSPSEDEENALGFSSGLEKRSGGGGGDEAPDDGNRVRFRLPSGSSDTSDVWQPPRKTHPRKTPKR